MAIQKLSSQEKSYLSFKHVLGVTRKHQIKDLFVSSILETLETMKKLKSSVKNESF